MARVLGSVQGRETQGQELTYINASADGHKFANNGRVRMLVKNGSGGSINVTVTTGKTEDGLAVEDVVTAVGDGKEGIFGPFNKDLYDQKSGADAGQVYVDFSATTSVSFALFE